MIVNSSLYNFPYAGMEGTGVPIRFVIWDFCTQSTSNSRARTFFKGKNVLFDNIQIPKRQLIELP